MNSSVKFLHWVTLGVREEYYEVHSGKLCNNMPIRLFFLLANQEVCNMTIYIFYIGMFPLILLNGL